MKYSVDWVESARDELANLWLAAANKQEITAAANRIDLLLQTNPDRQGYLVDNLRVLHVPPLRILFQVSNDDLEATVIEVHKK